MIICFRRSFNLENAVEREKVLLLAGMTGSCRINSYQATNI